jgi:hypothetical protein
VRVLDHRQKSSAIARYATTLIIVDCLCAVLSEYRTNIDGRGYGTYSGMLKFIPKNSNSVSNAVRLIDWALARRISAKISYPPVVKV